MEPKRTKYSCVWNFFDVKDSCSAVCSICKCKLSYKSSVSNLKKHLQRKHPTIQTGESKRFGGPSAQPTVSSVSGVSSSNSADEVSLDRSDQSIPTTSSSKSVDSNDLDNPKFGSLKKVVQEKISSFVPKKMSVFAKKKVDQELIGLFVRDFQPFSIVEDKGFRKFVNSLNPSYELPSRTTISSAMIPAAYERTHLKIKELVTQVESVCLTTDSWTSVNNDSFMAVTIHFIDQEFHLKSVLLECAIMQYKHTAINLANDLKRIVAQWGLENKITLAVSDNAANIKKAISEINNWKHFPCFAHTLNLIVQDALKKAQNIITKVRTIVTHFKKSSTAKTKLDSAQKNEGVQTIKKVIQDVATRWNSTFYMLSRFVELENSIRSTLGLLDQELPQITLEEWTIMKELCVILEPFEAATKAVSGENYLTASLVIVLNRGLLHVCEKHLEKDHFNTLSKELLNDLKNGLKTRLGNVEYSNTLSTCTFLDPRFKMFAFQNADAAEKAKRLVSGWVSELVNDNSSSTSKPSTSGISEEISEESDVNQEATNRNISVWDIIDQTVSVQKPRFNTNVRAVMEIQRYLEDDVLQREQNPLEWWCENKHNYPFLSKVARQKLCALGTSEPCERLFSKAGNLLNDRRTRLSSKRVEQILFLNSNFDLC